MIYWLQYFKKSENITLSDIAIFFRQFSTLMSAGIPIVQSCEILAKSDGKSTMRLLINAIKRDTLSGKNLFYCFQRHSRYFDKLICQLILLGEQTGKLDAILNIIAIYYEKNYALKQRIKQILFYPTVVTIMALIVTTCMFIFVIPRFAELFQNTNVQLPFLTVCIFYFSAKIREYFSIVTVIIVIFLLVMLILYQKHSNPFRFFQKLVSSVPFINTYLHKVNLLRFSRHLALTISAGIPITNALVLIANANSALKFTSTVMQLHKKMNAGIELHQAMTAFPMFPPLMVQMVRIGEESGMLETMLNKFTDFIEADINQFTHRLNQLLEPLIMTVLGVLIGILVIGMYLPIFKLGNAI